MLEDFEIQECFYFSIIRHKISLLLAQKFWDISKNFIRRCNKKPHKTITEPSLSVETIVGYFDGATQLGLCGSGMVTY